MRSPHGIHPVTTVDSALMNAIPDQFFIHPLTLLPAAIVIVLTLRRVPTRQTLLLSLASAVAIALLFQSASINELGLVLLRGLELPSTHPLHTVFRGGGLLRMVQVCGIVLASTALSGLLSGTGTFDPWKNWLRRWPGQRGLFGGTVLTGLMTSAFGCTQTIAIMLTQAITRPLYTASALSPEQHAVDLENSAVVLAPLIPWNIAGLVPATILLTDPGFIPYAFYLYLLPLLNWLWRKQSLLKPSVLASSARPFDPALVSSHASTQAHHPPEP